jgi:hypothetical protein
MGLKANIRRNEEGWEILTRPNPEVWDHLSGRGMVVYHEVVETALLIFKNLGTALQSDAEPG